MSLSLDDLALRVAAGERSALARALSLAERDPAAATRLLARLADKQGRSHVIGITGPSGAGKSTLVGALVRQFLQLGQRVAVLAVDPSSPVSGGALLGDRFRIGECADDGRSFVRSTATRGALGGLTAAARQMVQLMDAAGYDLVLVETVGTGQSEIDVARLADTLLVIFPPGLGDELQAFKAGILELADLLVVTKSDTAGAGAARQSLQTAAPMWRKAPPIRAVSALTGAGIADLAAVLVGRMQTWPGAPRRAGRCLVAPRASLAACAENIRQEIENRMAFDPAEKLSLSVLDPSADGQVTAVLLEYQGRFDAGGDDAFRRGAVAGALAILAGQVDLRCSLLESEGAGGVLRWRLERSGTAI